MKTFLKIFAIAFLCFAVAMGAGMWAFFKYYDASDHVAADKEEEDTPVDIVDSEKDKEEEDKRSQLERLIEKSKRTNILLLGMEGPRTDTIIFASFDPESKKLDLLSIPRDTYYERKGHPSADKKKINAVYGDEGAKGTMAAVSNVLQGVPIDYYVKVTYQGVERIVDSLGGVKVNIPMDMDYDDIYDHPPLHIHLQKGTQVLNGKKAVQFLRFRKNNDGGGYPDGDLGRMKAQQQFVKAALEKVFSFRLPVVANTVFKYVKTDMPLTDIVIMAKDAVGMSKDHVTTYSLPGKAVYNGVSYFLYDKDETKKLMTEIYGGQSE